MNWANMSLTMKILIYDSRNKQDKDSINTLVETFTSCQILFTDNYYSFETKLLSCYSGETVIVFFVNEEKDMDFLESTMKNLTDIKLIVNLLEKTSSLESRAYAIGARLVTKTDDNEVLLPLGLQGIIKEMHRNQLKISS